MTGSRSESLGIGIETLKYAPGKVQNSAETLEIPTPDLGQSCPQHCPHPEGAIGSRPNDPLGMPMTIREVARMLGCSEWTVRQRYLPKGLPYLRLSRQGKLLFFHNQIVRWILEIQRQKGGMIR